MTRNPGTNPGNADRLRVLEADARRLQLMQNNLLGMLQRYQRFPGGRRCSDLQPGPYQAFVGETIAPGESGLILITTCDGTVTETAINQTDCTFYMGNRITANVSPCCVIHFTGCNPSEPVDCCDKSIAVCVNGQRNILKVDGGWAAWSRTYDATCCSACDENRSWYLRVDLSCAVSTVTATWSLWCVGGQTEWEKIGEGTLDWSAVCDDPPEMIDDTLGVTGCDLQIVASPELFVDLCDPCDGSTPPIGCCDKMLWFCINNDSREMAVDGGEETWDVTECCPDCTSATVRLRLTCSNGIISVQRTYTCDGVVSNETTNISQYCSSTATTFLNIPTPNCFLQAQISIAEVACDACDPCESDPDNCVTVACCASPVRKNLTLTIVGGAFAGTYSMTYDGMLEWINDTGAFSARMSCEVGGWLMSFEMDNFSSDDDCPPLAFDVTGNGYGITSMVVS